MKYFIFTLMHKLNYNRSLSGAVFFFFIFVPGIRSQTVTPSEERIKVEDVDEREGALFGDYENPNRFLGYYNHRFRLQYGAGISRLSPVILNEAGPSWLTNSIIKMSQNPNEPFSYNAYTPKNITVYPLLWGLEYSFRDQFQVRFRSERISSVFNRNDPTQAIIASPRSDIYLASLFEGVRLLEYEENTKTYEISYTTPFFSWLKVGPVLGLESYSERNNFSFGSYTKTKPTYSDPLKETWTIGGYVDSSFRDIYFTPGIEAKAKVFSWLEVRGTASYIKRKGDFTMGGVQIVQTHTTDGNPDRYFPIFPVYAGHLSDTGYRTLAEATFRYCRFTATLGSSYQSMTRKYDSYYGRYLDNIEHVQFKSLDARNGGLGEVGIGAGEMLNKHKHSRMNAYLLLGVDFHSDFGIVKTRVSGARAPMEAASTASDRGEPEEIAEEETEESNQPENQSLGSLEEGELENMGTHNYLDKMYTGMRRDFEASGAVFEEMENGLKALGISLEKKRNENGEIRAIKVQIDGDMSFATGSANLTEKAKEMADHISEAMKAYPETNATVGGHTDSVGAKAYNLRLSQRRADAVKGRIIQTHSISESRIIWVKGFADDQKIINTMASEPRNRRVEIELTPAYVPAKEAEQTEGDPSDSARP